MSTTDRAFLHDRLGPHRAREVEAILAHVSVPAREQFLDTLRHLDGEMPAGPALLLGLARFCDTYADSVCASKEGHCDDDC